MLFVGNVVDVAFTGEIEEIKKDVLTGEIIYVVRTKGASGYVQDRFIVGREQHARDDK